MQNEPLDPTPTRCQQTHKSTWKKTYLENKGVLLILLAQVAGSSMDAIARFLQQGGRGIDPFQVCIRFARCNSTPFPSVKLSLLIN
jgi:hypothetical protein